MGSLLASKALEAPNTALVGAVSPLVKLWVAIGIVAAPSAAAAPDCSPEGVHATVSSVTGEAQQYLATHPGANQVVSGAYGQPAGDAAGNIRGYFTAHPNEYYDLRGILPPIGDTERQCNVTALPSNLESAYHEFMAG